MLNELLPSRLPVCSRSRLTLLVLAIAAGNLSAETLQPPRPIEPASTSLRAPASALRAPVNASSPTTVNALKPPAATTATTPTTTTLARPPVPVGSISAKPATLAPHALGAALALGSTKFPAGGKSVTAPPLSMVGIGYIAPMATGGSSTGALTGAAFKPRTATASPALSMAGIGYVAATAQPPLGGTAAPAFKPRIVTASPPLSMVGIGK
ncbi:MAG: hypothetical protein ABI905_17505 [Betaproteobacteria bacterium]